MYEESCFTQSEYLKTYPTGSKPAILYGQVKVYKLVEDNCPSFHPVLWAIDTPTYDLN